MIFKLIILFVQVENLVAIELAYINTKHPDFNKDAAFASSMFKDGDLEHKSRKNLSSASLPVTNAIVPFDKVSGMLIDTNFIDLILCIYFNN